MEKIYKEAIQVTKEIVVKFIESGRVSPANFEEIFPAVYQVVRATLVDSMLPPPARKSRESGRPDPADYNRPGEMQDPTIPPPFGGE